MHALTFLCEILHRIAVIVRVVLGMVLILLRGNYITFLLYIA